MSLSYRIKSFILSFTKPTHIDPPPFQHVVQIGDPILRHKAEPVPLKDIKTPHVLKVIHYLKKTMKLYDVVGISAPQIGVGLRILAFHYPSQKNSAYEVNQYKAMEMEEVKLNVWINPEMRVLDYSKVSHPEGCASVRGLIAQVPRFKKISLTGYNEDGKPQSLEAKGWTARIIQHEMDHLDGQIYVDIMEKKTLCNNGWQYINLMKGRVNLNYGPLGMK